MTPCTSRDKSPHYPEEMFLPHPLSILDLEWDTMDQARRERMSLENARHTAVFAREHIPFYRDHFRRLTRRNIEEISSPEEFAELLPETTKVHVSVNPPQAFIPEANGFRNGFCPVKGHVRNYGTGGTTGKPTTVVHTTEDWRAMVNCLTRSLLFDFRESLDELKDLNAFGLYHGDHVTNEAFECALAKTGINMYDRASTKPIPEHNYDLIQDVRPNILLGPPEDASGRQTKGITIDSILRIDARNPNARFPLNHHENSDFKMILWSSMPMSAEMKDYILEHLGIPYMQAHYGNTEVLSVGVTCCAYPIDFHLGYGSNLVLVKSLDGPGLAADGEPGYMLFSKVAGETAEGRCIVPTGTTLINYRPGDAGSITRMTEPCACGRTTPVLLGIHRVEFKEEKFNFGCQAD